MFASSGDGGVESLIILLLPWEKYPSRRVFIFCAGLASQKGIVAQVAEIRKSTLDSGNLFPKSN